MTQDHLETFVDECKAERSDYIVGIPIGSGQWRICYSAQDLGNDKLSPEDDLLVMLSTVLTKDHE